MKTVALMTCAICLSLSCPVYAQNLISAEGLKSTRCSQSRDENGSNIFGFKIMNGEGIPIYDSGSSYRSDADCNRGVAEMNSKMASAALQHMYLELEFNGSPSKDLTVTSQPDTSMKGRQRTTDANCSFEDDTNLRPQPIKVGGCSSAALIAAVKCTETIGKNKSAFKTLIACPSDQETNGNATVCYVRRLDGLKTEAAGNAEATGK